MNLDIRERAKVVITKLRKIKERDGVSQERLAREIGISWWVLSRWLRSEKPVVPHESNVILCEQFLERYGKEGK